MRSYIWPDGENCDYPEIQPSRWVEGPPVWLLGFFLSGEGESGSEHGLCLGRRMSKEIWWPEKQNLGGMSNYPPNIHFLPFRAQIFFFFFSEKQQSSQDLNFPENAYIKAGLSTCWQKTISKSDICKFWTKTIRKYLCVCLLLFSYL